MKTFFFLLLISYIPRKAADISELEINLCKLFLIFGFFVYLPVYLFKGTIKAFSRAATPFHIQTSNDE